jgi:hypothetical protein
MRKRRAASPTVAAAEVPATDFRAVAIYAALGSCRPAQRLRGKRFLNREAPPIPLAQCPQPTECPCRYLKYADRRAGDRRDIATSGRWYTGVDRRRTNGRRADDQQSRIELM